MNTRQAIQPSQTPAVLSLSFSGSRKRFVAGLSTGPRVFRTDNCLTTYQPKLPNDGGVNVAEIWNDRYIVLAGGGRVPAGKPNVFLFWDCVLDKEVCRFDLYEPILGMRLSERWLAVVLRERTVIFEYQRLDPSKQRHASLQTGPNSDEESD
jgi:WD repeat-containing protein 45